MKCPFCDSVMRETNGRFTCPGGGPLLTKESGPCPYTARPMDEAEINNIAIFLIDNDGGD